MAQQLDSPEPGNRSWLTLKRKCSLGAILVMLSPVLAWPLLALFVVGGCEGGISRGLGCPPILGIHFHLLPTDLLLYSVKGFALSIPIGIALFVLCHFVGKKHKS